MIQIRSSKYLSSLLFCKRGKVLQFGDDIFSKGGFLAPAKKILLLKNRLWSSVGHQFQISFGPTFLFKRPWFFRFSMLFCQKEAFQSMKMTFYYSRKISIFKNGFTHDSRHKFPISFEPTFLYKRPWFWRLIMLFCQKEAFQSIKTTFYYSREICIF